MLRRGYSLIELLVVLGIIAALTSMSLPGLMNNDERYFLNTEANRIKQMLILARTYSLAPVKNDTSGATQMYQVAFGPFTANAGTNATILGDINTNQVALQKGPAGCSDSLVSGSTTSIKSYKMRRNIYVSSFYPMDYVTGSSTGIVRFSVGRTGFTCGADGVASIDSLNFKDNRWLSSSGGSLQARYLVIELTTRKLQAKSYVILDRLNSEVSVSRFNPQKNFSSLVDTFSPRWLGTPQTAKLQVSCGVQASQMTLTFSRASDRYADNSTDDLRPVFYDIAWKFGGIPNPGPSHELYEMLSTHYFYDVSEAAPSTPRDVQFQFSSESVSVANQPEEIDFRIYGSDTLGNYQMDSSAQAEDRYRDIVFHRGAGANEWGCGQVAITTIDNTDEGTTDPIDLGENPRDDGNDQTDNGCPTGPTLPCTLPATDPVVE